MTDITDTMGTAESPPERGRLGLMTSLAVAAALSGSSFYSIYAGYLDPTVLLHETKTYTDPVGDVAFVPLQPIVVSLAPDASARLLRFAGQVEVTPEHVNEIERVMPRVLDVLNTYLRAVDTRDLENPSSLPRLRAQMLRRIQVVAGEGLVRNLLITEFVLN